MTIASSGAGLETGWLRCGATRSLKIRGRILGLTLALYLSLYLAVAGQVGSWTWANGRHVTPEHLNYHTLLLYVGITDHHIPNQEREDAGLAGLERALLTRGLQTPAIDIDHGAFSVFFSAAQHLSGVDTHPSAPADNWTHPTAADRMAPASPIPPPPEPPPRAAA